MVVTRFGLLTIGRHKEHFARTGEYLRVYVNGEDVTDRCRVADDIEGYAVVNVVGERDVDGTCVRKVRLTGAVEIRPAGDAAAGV